MFRSKKQCSNFFRISIFIVSFFSITACSTRDVQSELNGSSAQRLISHSIDDLVSKLKDQNLTDLKDKKVYLNSYFINMNQFKDYADHRLALELQSSHDCFLYLTGHRL